MKRALRQSLIGTGLAICLLTFGQAQAKEPAPLTADDCVRGPVPERGH